MLNVILFGPPGSGKGTQSKKLIDKYQLVHLSTGDIFRQNIKDNTELGQLAKNYMSKGLLVPDEVTIKMLEAEVNKTPNANGFIFDGFPRTILQSEALDSFLASKNAEINVLLAMSVDEDELRSRLKERAIISNRPDDANPEIIQKRIDVYKNETLPVMNYYSNKNKFASVNGVGPIDEVFARLCEVLDEVHAQKNLN